MLPVGIAASDSIVKTSRVIGVAWGKRRNLIELIQAADNLRRVELCRAGPLRMTPGNQTVSETGVTGTPLSAFTTVIGGDCAAVES
jgi:hypothetical protein